MVCLFVVNEASCTFRIFESVVGVRIHRCDDGRRFDYLMVLRAKELRKKWGFPFLFSLARLVTSSSMTLERQRHQDRDALSFFANPKPTISLFRALPATMLSKSLLFAVLLVACDAFSSRTPFLARQARSSSARSLEAVKDVGSEAEFDSIIMSTNALVVIDYSTTWCGPCKVIAPKFEEFSEKYRDAVFLKVIGDASPDASKLMKREGVRSVPSFHYFVNGQKVDVVNGANAEAIEAAITKHVMA